MRARVALLLALSAVLLAACNNTGSESANAAKGRPVDKILVIVIENKSFDQMRSEAPKIWALGQKFGYATDFEAITHPSLPNYLVMAAGSTLGVTDDAEPDEHPLTGPSVFGGTIAAGRTAAIMADGMGPAPCDLNAHGTYVPRHVPWAYFVDERESCQKFATDAQDFDAKVAAGELPNVGMLVPDQCHNAHSCPLGEADDWVAGKVQEAMTGPDWKSGKLAIVLTADEDDRKAGNQILTVVVHPSQDHHVVSKHLTMYSLHRFLARVGHTDPLGEGTSAPDMAKAFGLRIR